MAVTFSILKLGDAIDALVKFGLRCQRAFAPGIGAIGDKSRHRQKDEQSRADDDALATPSKRWIVRLFAPATV